MSPGFQWPKKTSRLYAFLLTYQERHKTLIETGHYATGLDWIFLQPRDITITHDHLHLLTILKELWDTPTARSLYNAGEMESTKFTRKEENITSPRLETNTGLGKEIPQ